MIPKIINGGKHTDVRGSVLFNNSFDATVVKRIYIIENHSTDFMRGWQGHKIEQRWFSALSGSFKIQLIAIDNWGQPSKNLQPISFIIKEGLLNLLHIPQGYISSIQSLELDSKLLVMADYLLGEINDEYRYDIDYFKI